MKSEKVVTTLETVSTSKWDEVALREDLPTAKELAQFVADRTGVFLDLVGKSKALQYKIAIKVLDGEKVDKEWITDKNPNIDTSDIIPEEPMRPIPARGKDLPEVGLHFNNFGASGLPHPQRPQSEDKVAVEFKKYPCGTITYEVTGPIELKPVGTKMNKYGQQVPEQYVWDDARTGEQILQRPDGSLAGSVATGLKVFMTNTYKAWHMIDVPLAASNQKALDNPWAA